MKKLLAVFAIFLLAACSSVAEVIMTDLEYKQALGIAVCRVVQDLNSRGVLADEKVIAAEFDPLIQHFIQEMGYSSEEWLAAKNKYFPNEAEHTKLIKMHFTWCLMGDSFQESDSSD
jgi:hypothetical protein